MVIMNSLHNMGGDGWDPHLSGIPRVLVRWTFRSLSRYAIPSDMSTPPRVFHPGSRLQVWSLLCSAKEAFQKLSITQKKTTTFQTTQKSPGVSDFRYISLRGCLWPHPVAILFGDCQSFQQGSLQIVPPWTLTKQCFKRSHLNLGEPLLATNSVKISGTPPKN